MDVHCQSALKTNDCNEKKGYALNSDWLQRSKAASYLAFQEAQSFCAVSAAAAACSTMPLHTASTLYSKRCVLSTYSTQTW